jgi:hypothetical protein
VSTPVAAKDLKPGQVVMITVARNAAQGFVGKMFKVLATDWPYGCLLWLESAQKSKYTEDFRNYDFAIPSEEYIQSAVPDESWPTHIGERSTKE